MNSHLCQRCESFKPEFICFCAEVRLCEDCISQHLLSEPSLAHKPLPLISSELIRSAKKGKALQSPEAAEESLKRHILTSELRRLKSFQAEALIQLQRAKLHYEAEISKTIEDLSVIVQNEVMRLTADLECCLGELSDRTPPPSAQSHLLQRLGGMNHAEQLLTLDIEFRQVDVAAILKQSLLFTLQHSKLVSVPTKLFKFFGGSNCVAVFAAEKEVYEKQITVTQKFLHNSSWCLTPSGEVIVTGGSLTGHSRNNALMFNTNTGMAQDLEPMNIARRSHASVYYQGCCYVFGGGLEEEQISMCERYDSEVRTWSALPHMQERRQYLGACVFRNLIIICGGAATSSCEVFNPADLTFQYVPVPSTDLADVASIVPVGDSILIFHGNMNGEVSRLYPLTNQVSKEAKFCYGNSWSSCAPLVCGDNVYVLRADSIFKYNLTTHNSSYILRMTKTKRNAND